MKLEDYINKLLRGNYFIDEAVIMGPYVTSLFFEQLSKKGGENKSAYPRSKLTILADDGWDQQELDLIQSIYKEKRRGAKRELIIRRVSPLEKSGLVHVKVYFFTVKNIAKTYTKKILLLGSANASMHGFGIHAESFVNIDLADISTEYQEALIDYINKLKAGTCAKGIIFQICRGSWISLPHVEVVNQAIYSGFDAWLRRGRLCHKYQPDNSFGKLSVQLIKPLPPREWEGSFFVNGFGTEKDKKIFSRKYTKNEQKISAKEKAPKWRSQYFVETFYGHWTSAECYRRKRSEFVDVNASIREKIVEEIKSATDKEYEEWCDNFVKSIKLIGSEIKRNNESQLGEFFHVKHGDVDEGRYKTIATSKIDSDKKLSGDGVFSDRYISGYSFPRFPQLGDEYEEFAINWCDDILNKMRRHRVENKYANTIKDLLGNKLPYTGEELLEWIRQHWGKLDIGQKLEKSISNPLLQKI